MVFESEDSDTVLEVDGIGAVSKDSNEPTGLTEGNTFTGAATFRGWVYATRAVEAAGSSRLILSVTFDFRA